jgi:pyruvate,water dikinase
MHLDLDTPVDPDFPVYTRANAGEVLPGIVSPLGWSLIGLPAEEGFRRSLVHDMGALPDLSGKEFLLVGRFAGRFHLNLSAIRTAAEHIVGTSAAAVDHQYLGDASAQLGSDLPAHRAGRWDKAWYFRSGPAAGRTLAVLDRRVRRERAEVLDLAGRIDRFLAAGPTDEAIVDRLGSLRSDFARAFGTHITARALASPALELLKRALASAGAPPDLGLRLLTGLDGVESSQPSLELGRLAAGIGADSPLGKALAGGLSHEELQVSALPGAGAARDEVAGFLERFGHRGVNEYEPTFPAWQQAPDQVVRLLAHLLGTTEDPGHPGTLQAAARADLMQLGLRGRLARPLVANAQRSVVRGETTKATAIRVSHLMRRLIWELRRRWESAGVIDPGDVALLSLAELQALARTHEAPARLLEERRRQLAEAEQVDVPEVLVGAVKVVPLETGRLTAESVEGIAGSSGLATARARVMADPAAEFEDGEVLVTSVTDTAWTPLFLAAAAVVTDIGGVLSHATVVARDLGIPAVVNTKVGTRTIRTGDLVEVDGGAGTVRIIERSRP